MGLAVHNRHMRQALLAPTAAALLIVSVGVAEESKAADLAPAATLDVPSSMPAAPNWSGLYVGIHGGYGWADITHTDTFGTTPDTVNYDVDGGLFGGQIGYNVQFGNAVLGIEGDIAWSGIDGSTAGPPIPASFDLDVIATIRGRFGWAFDSFLLFGSIGAAWADVGTTQGGFGSDSNSHTGIVLGAGGAWRATDNISFTAEYLYGNFGEESYDIGGAPDLVDFETHMLRAALNWHLPVGR